MQGRIRFSFTANECSPMIATLDGHTIFLARRSPSDKNIQSKSDRQTTEFVVTTAGGVSVSLDAAGTVRLNRPRSSTKCPVESNPVKLLSDHGNESGSCGRERVRQILSNGTVAKLSEANTTIYLPNGDMSERSCCEKDRTVWLNTNANGERFE